MSSILFFFTPPAVYMSNKVVYGEVNTDLTLVNNMLDLVPKRFFSDPLLKWLDPACGQGNFMIALYKRLFKGLSILFPDPQKRMNHIHQKMLFMVEINEAHISHLQTTFPNANIFHQDFLTFAPEHRFDMILGNPPFNIQGLKKVPTNTTQKKKEDGKTAWTHFIRRSIYLLKKKGHLLMITPSIWMKPDKANIYPLLTKYQLKNIRCFTNTQSNKLFHGKAQTPICYFLMQKCKTNPEIINLYEKSLERYIPYILTAAFPIPVFGASVFAKLLPYVLQVGTPNFIKTNMPRRHTVISKQESPETPHKNIRTCILQNDRPVLIYEYSNIPLSFSGKKKLILAHKMYGFPYHDKKGEYGVSRRDNYILTDLSARQLERWCDFLTTNFALYLFEGTRYRMKYLEKYVFQLIPDITKLDDFPTLIDDQTIADYFQLTTIEREAIHNLHKKSYFD